MLAALDASDERIEVKGVSYRRLNQESAETYLALRGAIRVKRTLRDCGSHRGARGGRLRDPAVHVSYPLHHLNRMGVTSRIDDPGGPG
jgi:hypothetical protein